MEGWAVWELGLSAQGQLRVAGMGGVIGWDMTAVLALARASGIADDIAAALLPPLETGLVSGLRRSAGDGGTVPGDTT